jgi:peptidoglycan/xylan/chitin deacetylase (PgdA/CDA1 family)
VILLVVNHHYVADEPARSPRAIFPLDVAALTARLDVLGRSFEFVSRDDVLGAVRGEKSLPERSCLVTFDDGLRSQFELALPALVRLGVPALFLVPGRPLAEGRALFVHKVHHLRERLGDEALLPLLAGHAPAVSTEAARGHYAYDEPEAARVKYLLNVALPLEEREDVIAAAFRHAFPDERSFCADLYMSRAQVRELERTHGAVGAHSYAHEPLALLDGNALARDLASSAETLADVTGVRPEAISYPHGSQEAVSPDVAAAAARVGFVAGFTMERAFNRTLEQPLLLARVDANDVPGGSRPLFDFDGHEPGVRPGMTPARTRYLAEARTPPR